MGRKLLVIGLDSAPPSLVYNRFRDSLPTLSILTSGNKAILRSSHPPITIPAWAVMVTGKSPGELGLYGFRHRKPGSYNDVYIASSRSIKSPAIWDLAGREGLKSVVVGVPPSYPPRPIRGAMVGCFITPGPESPYTFPPRLKGEMESALGPYIFDAEYRSDDKESIIGNLWKMTKYQFRAYRFLMKRLKWDFFMFVQIGVDRVQHAFWGYMDKDHHKYTPGNRYENVIEEYYRLVDEELGKMIKETPADAVIAVVSDHGAKRMKGAFVVNQWLAEKGYLKIEKMPPPGTDLSEARIDWRKTIAWGWGGYYARIFLNVEGREPKGVIRRDDYEHYRTELIEEISRIEGPGGEEWDSYAFRPEELYPVVRGDVPDLIAYFDDLYWRSAGTVGWDTKYLRENDRGPDDAVHDWFGIISLYDPEESVPPLKEKLDIKEVFQIFAEILGLGEQ